MPSRLRPLLSLSNRLDAFNQSCKPFVQHRAFDREGRHELNVALVIANNVQIPFERVPHNHLHTFRILLFRVLVVHDVETDFHTQAANVPDLGMIRQFLLEPTHDVLPIPFGLLPHFVTLMNLERSERGGAGQWRSAKSR